MTDVMPTTERESWDVQRRHDGAVLVRVHSCDRQGRQLPDAVFAFRLGDPQYDYWERQLRQQNAGRPAGAVVRCLPKPGNARQEMVVLMASLQFMEDYSHGLLP